MSNHKCDVPHIDYSQADRGLISCQYCGRDWTLGRDKNGKVTGWKPDPKPVGRRSQQW
jgi:hypothetical protein